MSTVLITKSGLVLIVRGTVSDGGYVISTVGNPQGRAELKKKYVARVFSNIVWNDNIEEEMRDKYPECFI